MRLSISFFISACFFFNNRSFSFDTKLRNAGTASAVGFRPLSLTTVLEPMHNHSTLFVPAAAVFLAASAFSLPLSSEAAVPSGPLTDTRGTSLPSTVGPTWPVLRAPGGTYAFALRTTAPYLLIVSTSDRHLRDTKM